MNDERRRPHDDELLSALIDGELPEAEADRLKARLEREPLLARRHEELQAANALIGRTFGVVVDEPVPDRVTRRVREAPRESLSEARPDAPRETETTVVPFRRFGVSHVYTAVAAMAAGVLIAALFLVRPSATDPVDPTSPSGPAGPAMFLSAGRVEAGTPYHDVLDGLPSGETRALTAGWTAAPRFTFVSRDGDPCRRVDLRGAEATLETVACRRAGAWRVDLVAYAPPLPEGEFYGAASGGSSRVDAAIDGDPLGAEQERAWIERGWEDAR